MEKQIGNASMKLPGLTYRDGVGLVEDSSGMPTQMQGPQKLVPTWKPENGSEFDRDKFWQSIRTLMHKEFSDLLAITQWLSGTGVLPAALVEAWSQQIEFLMSLLEPTGAPTAGPSESSSTPTKSAEKPCEKPVSPVPDKREAIPPARDTAGNRFAASRNWNKFTLWSWRLDGADIWVVFPPYGGVQYFKTWNLAIQWIDYRISAWVKHWLA